MNGRTIIKHRADVTYKWYMPRTFVIKTLNINYKSRDQYIADNLKAKYDV